MQRVADLSKYRNDKAGPAQLAADVRELDRIAADLAQQTETVQCLLLPAKQCLAELSESTQAATDRLRQVPPAEFTLPDLKLLCSQCSARIPDAALAALVEPGRVLTACTSAKELLSVLKLELKDYLECLRLFAALRQLSSHGATAAVTTASVTATSATGTAADAATTSTTAAPSEAAGTPVAASKADQSAEELCEWLVGAGFGQAVGPFKQQGVTGAMLAAADVPFASTILAISRKRLFQIKEAFVAHSCTSSK